jgi:hypothetical protein
VRVPQQSEAKRKLALRVEHMVHGRDVVEHLTHVTVLALVLPCCLEQYEI